MAQITKRLTASGENRYDVRTRIAGRVVTRTFRRRNDADSYASTVEADKLRGVEIDPRRGRVTLADYAATWLADRHDLAERTTDLYRWLLDCHIFPKLGKKTVGTLTPPMVRTWYARLHEEHPTTAAKAYRLLRGVLSAAVVDEVIARNPCQIRGASVEKSPERPVATVSEVGALVDAMPEHLRLLVLLACWCQLRRGELLGLRRRDIDLLHSTITVEQSRTFTMDGNAVTKGPKTQSGRRNTDRARQRCRRSGAPSVQLRRSPSRSPHVHGRAGWPFGVVRARPSVATSQVKHWSTGTAAP